MIKIFIMLISYKLTNTINNKNIINKNIKTYLTF